MNSNQLPDMPHRHPSGRRRGSAAHHPFLGQDDPRVGGRGHRRGPRGFGHGRGPGFGRGHALDQDVDPGFDPGADFGSGREFGPRFGRGSAFGPGSGFRPGSGFGPRPGPRGRRGRRARGDTRLAVLALLAEQPRHGYEIIQEISERTGGVWRPSPGSIYPTLQQLEDEGLVRTEEADGRRTVRLTESGQAYVEQRREQLNEVWRLADGELSGPVANLRTQYGQLHAAVAQLMSAGTDAQRESTANALAEARKTIYRLLTED
jgi:DNA-binding PadR family transcriptional regulator